MRFRTFDEYLEEEFKKPGFKEGFEREQRKLQIGYQVFLARKKAGMTQAELAKRIGTRQGNISRLEQGDYNFTVEMLDKIARALKMDLTIKLSSPKHAKAA